MAINQLKVTGINPILSVLGDTQRFNYNPDNTFFSIKSNFQPIQNVNSNLSMEFRNIFENGFRITHETDINGGVGQLKFKHFSNSSLIGTDLATVNQNGFIFNTSPSFPNPVNPTDAANKQYVDGKTWLTSQITNFDTAVRAYKLSDFLSPSANISFANFNLINLANPINPQDAVTKSYADNMQKTVTLSGAVSGSGSTGSTITTAFNLRLDQIAFPTANISLNGYKIINLATPTLATDAVTKAYVDSSVGGVATSITLQGDISGTGSTGSAITTTFNKRLDQITAPTASLNLNSQKIINLAIPVLSTDAASKSYVDSAVSVFSTTLTLQGAISGSGSTSSAIATTLNTRLDQVPPPTQAVSLNSQRITNLATPTQATDAVTKAYADSLTPSGGGDTFQVLPSQSSVTWNFSSGNIANITLTTDTTITPTPGTISKGTLIVKQDATGGRKLSLPAGIYRTGATSPVIPLSTAANSLDVLTFQRDGSNNLYLTSITYQMVQIGATPTNKYIFVYSGAIVTLPIVVSANNVCRIKVLGGGGGQGLYNGSGNSGAGGYTIFQFSTTSYIGQEIKLVVGGGGQGGNYTNNIPGAGGYPNGGRGINGDTYCGGGGGRSDVRIGPNTVPFSAATFVAIAGGGGGGTGFSGYGGAGGGNSGQNAQSTTSTGGSQTAGGTSAASPPAQFQQAGFLQGAGATVQLTGQGYDTGGGGDGYYGGGCSGGDGQASSGGSGYINTTFSGYLSSYGGISSGTFVGNQTAIPTQASSDTDFQDGSGVGRVGGSYAAGVGMNGGNGKIIVEFL